MQACSGGGGGMQCTPQICKKGPLLVIKWAKNGIFVGELREVRFKKSTKRSTFLGPTPPPPKKILFTACVDVIDQDTGQEAVDVQTAMQNRKALEGHGSSRTPFNINFQIQLKCFEKLCDLCFIHPFILLLE